MTLDTRVYVHGEVDRRELFTECQRIIGQWDADRRGPDRQHSEDDEWGDHRVLMNKGCQGLPGWLMVHYRPDGAYRTAAQSLAHDEWCNVPGGKSYNPDTAHCDPVADHSAACWLEVSLDTAYSYRGPDDMGCGDMHARFVAELGLWLDQREIAWSWHNEFTNEVFGGDDRYEKLITLASGGFEASAWFRTTVAPALSLMLDGITKEDTP